MYRIRLIAKHLAGEPFRLSLHRLLSPSAVPHSLGLNVFDIYKCVLVLLSLISFVLAFPCTRISVYTDNKEANVNDPSHNRNMVHNISIEHNTTNMCSVDSIQVAVI